MVCFILQSPPHIDREPVSFITLGSCPPFQSQHTTDLLLSVDGEQIGPGRVMVVVGGGGAGIEWLTSHLRQSGRCPLLRR